MGQMMIEMLVFRVKIPETNYCSNSSYEYLDFKADFVYDK